MIHAYDKVYLERARTNLGRMLDYSTYDLGYDSSDFFGMFLRSGVARRFERGDFTLITGKSGVELAYEVLDRVGKEYRRVSPRYASDRSPEYWAGWALAYYQWETGLSFGEIVSVIPVREILSLYSPYHEMDIRHFADQISELYRQRKPETNLKFFRQSAGLSQSELAALSEVPVRTIQQYEQRQKNLNKAQAETLFALSRALGCEAEQLLEKVE